MKVTKFILIIIFLLCIPSTSLAEVEIEAITEVDPEKNKIEAHVYPEKMGSNTNGTYTFNIQNIGEEAVYLLRIEAPLGSSINFSELLACPEDRDLNDSYNWAFNWSGNQVTCQTSANSDNPNILSPGDTEVILVRATIPNITSDTNFNWLIISENNVDFSRNVDSSATITIDSSPPAVTQVQAKDENNNGLIDAVALTFDETIDITSVLASDFSIDNVAVDTISLVDNKTLRLNLGNNEIDTTEMPSVSYYPSFSGVNVNDLGQTLPGFSSLGNIEQADTLPPKVIYTHITNNPLRIGNNEITIIFSEPMNTTNIPIVKVDGSGTTHEATMIKFLGSSYKGIIRASSVDIIDINNLTIIGAKDLNDNDLANVNGSSYVINTGKTSTVSTNVVPRNSNQLEQISLDSTNILNDNVSLWNIPNDSEKILEFYNKYTKDLIIEHENLGSEAISAISHFITYGTPSTKILGSGERAGVIGSYKSAFGKLPKTKNDWEDVLKISIGRWPGESSGSAESRAKISFRTIYKRVPNMEQPNDNAAVTVMAYGLRPSNRNLGSEKVAIRMFKKIFNYNPGKSTNWDAVRAIAYSGATR